MSLQNSTCHSAIGGATGERSEVRSMSAPERIWFLTALETGRIHGQSIWRYGKGHGGRQGEGG